MTSVLLLLATAACGSGHYVDATVIATCAANGGGLILSGDVGDMEELRPPGSGVAVRRLVDRRGPEDGLGRFQQRIPARVLCPRISREFRARLQLRQSESLERTESEPLTADEGGPSSSRATSSGGITVVAERAVIPRTALSRR